MNMFLSFSSTPEAELFANAKNLFLRMQKIYRLK